MSITHTIYPSGATNNAASATGTITTIAKANLLDLEKAAVLTTQNGGKVNFIYKVTAAFVPPVEPLGEKNQIVDIISAVSAEDVASALANEINNPIVGGFNVLKFSRASGFKATRDVDLTPTAQDSTLYRVTINGTDNDFTSDASATVAEITAGLTAAINANTSLHGLTVTDEGPGTLVRLLSVGTLKIADASLLAESGAVIDVRQTAVGVAGNVTITDTVADGGYATTGFTGGLDGPPDDADTYENLVTNTHPAWVGSTAYAVDDLSTNGGEVYECTAAGTSAASGGPSGTGTSITDGTVTWRFATFDDGSLVLVKSHKKADAPSIITPWIMDKPFTDFLIPIHDTRGKKLYDRQVSSQTLAGLIDFGGATGLSGTVGQSRAQLTLPKAATIRGDVDGSGNALTEWKTAKDYDLTGWLQDKTTLLAAPDAGSSRVGGFVKHSQGLIRLHIFRSASGKKGLTDPEKLPVVENILCPNSGIRITPYYPCEIKNVKHTNGAGLHVQGELDPRSVYPNFKSKGSGKFDNPRITLVKDAIGTDCVTPFSFHASGAWKWENPNLKGSKGAQFAVILAFPNAGLRQHPDEEAQLLVDWEIDGGSVEQLEDPLDTVTVPLIVGSVESSSDGSDTDASKIRINTTLKGGDHPLAIVSFGGSVVSDVIVKDGIIDGGVNFQVLLIAGGVDILEQVLFNDIEFLNKPLVGNCFLPITVSRIVFSDNDFRNSGATGIIADGVPGGTHQLIFCSDCVVAENKKFPAGLGEAENFVTVLGGSGNQVVDDINEAEDPPGIAAVTKAAAEKWAEILRGS